MDVNVDLLEVGAICEECAERFPNFLTLTRRGQGFMVKSLCTDCLPKSVHVFGVGPGRSVVIQPTTDNGVKLIV